MNIVELKIMFICVGKCDVYEDFSEFNVGFRFFKGWIFEIEKCLL